MVGRPDRLGEWIVCKAPCSISLRHAPFEKGILSEPPTHLLMMKRTNLLIIGSGVAGLSTAYHLTHDEDRECPAIVLEKEDQLGPHASSKNSGMIHHFHPDRSMRRKIAEGVERLRDLRDETGRSFLTDRTSLFLFPEETAKELEQDDQPWGGRASRASSTVPASLKPDPLPDGAAWHAFEKDGLIDSDELLRVLADGVSRKGVPVRLNRRVTSARRTEDGWRVEAGGETIEAQQIVNAAGAWADRVAELFGVEPNGLVPYARHLFVADETLLPPELGFYWDDVHDVYFRHHKKGTLLSVCDNHRGTPGRPPDVEDPETLLLRTLHEHYPRFEDLTVTDHWWCHRTRAPERVPYIEEDPEQDRFYWVGGLEGHGITASMWAGHRAAEMIEL